MDESLIELKKKIDHLMIIGQNNFDVDVQFNYQIKYAKREALIHRIDDVLKHIKNYVQELMKKQDLYKKDVIVVSFWHYLQKKYIFFVVCEDLFINDYYKEGESLFTKISQYKAKLIHYKDLIKRIYLLKYKIIFGEIDEILNESPSNLIYSIMDEENPISIKIGANLELSRIHKIKEDIDMNKKYTEKYNKQTEEKLITALEALAAEKRRM